MNMREMMRNVPNGILAVIIVCVTVAFLGTLGALVYMATTGADSAPVAKFIDTALNFVLLIVAGTGATAAVSAAKSAAAAEKQTNGELTPRIKNAVTEVLNERNGGADDGGPTL